MKQLASQRYSSFGAQIYAGHWLRSPVKVVLQEPKRVERERRERSREEIWLGRGSSHKVIFSEGIFVIGTHVGCVRSACD